MTDLIACLKIKNARYRRSSRPYVLTIICIDGWSEIVGRGDYPEQRFSG